MNDCNVIRHPNTRAAEAVQATEKYLAGLWEDKVKSIRRLAIFDVIMFLASIGNFYLYVHNKSATLYLLAGYALGVGSLLMALVIVAGYFMDKKSHADKSARMLKTTRQK